MEIRFYFVCRRMMGKIENNFSVLGEWLKGMSFARNYDTDKLQQVAAKVLPHFAFQPSRDEYILLAHKFKYPTRKILEDVDISAMSHYRISNKYRDGGYTFKPMLDKEEHAVIKDFMETLEMIKDCV